MIIKDYKYMNSTGGIRYTINVDGIELEMHHEKTEYGSVRHTDIYDFLDELADFDHLEAELIQDFVSFQNNLLMYGVGFIFKNAEEME